MSEETVVAEPADPGDGVPAAALVAARPVRARVRARTGRAARRPPSPTAERLTALIGVELTVVAAVLALGSALPLLGGLDWRADLFAHFTLHAAAAALTVALLCRSLGQRVGARLALAALGLNLAAAAGLAPALSWERPITGASVRVTALNVLASNTGHARVAAWLEASNAEVVVLSELTPDWRDLLASLERAFPHRALSFGRGRGDVAVLSRLPLAAAAVETVGDQPLVSAKVVKDGRPLTVLAAHPHSPMTEGRWTARNRMLKRLGERAAAAGGPVMVAGDLNTTPWSRAFVALLESGRLSGPLLRAGTYPGWLDAFGLPIDHVLVGGGAWVDGVAAAPGVGSDHRPLTAVVHF